MHPVKRADSLLIPRWRTATLEPAQPWPTDSNEYEVVEWQVVQKELNELLNTNRTLRRALDRQLARAHAFELKLLNQKRTARKKAAKRRDRNMIAK